MNSYEIVLNAWNKSLQERKLTNPSINLDHLNFYVTNNKVTHSENTRIMALDLYLYLIQKRHDLGDENIPLNAYTDIISHIFKLQLKLFNEKPFLELRDNYLFYIPSHDQLNNLVEDILMNQQIFKALQPLVFIADHLINQILTESDLPILKNLNEDFKLLLKPDPVIFHIFNDRLKTLAMLYAFVNLNAKHRKSHLLECHPEKITYLLIIEYIEKDLNLIKSYLEDRGEVILEESLEDILTRTVRARA